MLKPEDFLSSEAKTVFVVLLAIALSLRTRPRLHGHPAGSSGRCIVPRQCIDSDRIDRSDDTGPTESRPRGRIRVAVWAGGQLSRVHDQNEAADSRPVLKSGRAAQRH